MTKLSTVVAEQTEIGAYADFAGGAPAAVRNSVGTAVLNVGSATALTIRHDSTRFWTKAGGFGDDGPITADTMATVCEFFREQGVPLGSIQIAPSLLPDDWAEIAEKLNITEGARFAKLWCDVDDALAQSKAADSLAAGLRVGPVEPEQAAEWADVMMNTFGFPDDGMAETAASSVGRANWRSYAVWDGSRIVAVGSLFVHGECGDMFGGATVPDARGRGAQLALLAARIHAAKVAGCTWIVAETGAEEPGEHNTSLRNMLRAGFQPMYERANWVWRAPINEYK